MSIGTGGAGGSSSSDAAALGGTSPVIPWDASAIDFDAVGCVEPPDPGTPPPDCIAPCIWNVMAPCRLSSCCGQETRNDLPYSPFPTLDQSCDKNGVLVDYKYVLHENDTYVYNRGQLCYSMQFPYGSGETSGPRAWKGPQGEPVASDFGVTGAPHSVTCSDGTVYTTDITQPKCAPWVSPTCVPGTCASDR